MFDKRQFYSWVTLCSIILLPATWSFPANAADPSDPVSFQERAGNWVILGDVSVGACLSKQTDLGRTELLIASLPAQETIRFSLSNAAWKSLTDGDLRITATFHSPIGKITDSWDLDSSGTSEEQSGPRIHFDIWRAKNDGVSFIEQFRRSSSVWFWRDSVPIAKFNLSRSDAMMESLLRCRATLRQGKDFDPFAN